MKRRILRKIYQENSLYEQIPFIPTPHTYTYAREKGSTIATVFYFFGALLLILTATLHILSWILDKFYLPLPITFPQEIMTFVPIMFVFGLILSIIGTVIKPTANKIILFVFLVLIYAAFSLGWVDQLFGFFFGL